VIAVHVRSVSDTASVLALDSVARTDWSGLVVHREISTNTVPAFAARVRSVLPSSVEATFHHAVGRYDDLLRRLAD
jgi:hypothetical protein